MGIRIAPLTSELAGQLRLKNDAKGVVLADVESGSPAEAAGLRPGDLIVRVGQMAVTTPEDVKTAVRKILDSQTDNKSVALFITRGGASQYVMVAL